MLSIIASVIMTGIEAGNFRELRVTDLRTQYVKTMAQGGPLYLYCHQEVFNQVVLLLDACAAPYRISD